MRILGVLALGSSSLLWAPACFAAQQQRLDAAEILSPQLSISYEKGLLRLSIRDCQLLQVFEELAAKTRVAIFPAPGVGAERVSLEVANVGLEEGLRRLLHDQSYDLFFYYRSVKQGPASLRAVWIYPPGEGEGLKPVPPEAWASSRELEAYLGDADPRVRERAYEAFLDRPGAHHRELILDALRGTRETDDGVRERLLSAAVSRGVAIPADLLVDLATTDRSEQIRWMALNALAQDAAVRPVAEAALNDPSPSVRERARDILNELENASRHSDVPGRP
jgi:hypothetical protein